MRSLTLFFSFILVTTNIQADTVSTIHFQRTLDIYRAIIAVDTSKTKNNTMLLAEYLAGQLEDAGFSSDLINVISLNGFGSLVVRYPAKKAIHRPMLLLGHLDVVEAFDEDWVRPPFTLTEDGTNYYARGAIDNKFGVAQLVSTFIRLKEEEFVPNREIFLVFSGDEETYMRTTRMLANELPELRNAEFALNSDSGGGELDGAGKPLLYTLQAAEKTYATWEITVRNPGGHSSRPRLDNAIYELSDAIKAIQNFRFPVMWTEMTLSYFENMGRRLDGPVGNAMRSFALDPNNEKASKRLFREPSYVGTTRTTCVVTMLRAGHAENALPQSATATINCRIFPGILASLVEKKLISVVANPNIEFRLLDEVVESPISELRPDVVRAVSRAVHDRYPGLQIIPTMESGATDGAHFRKAGIPTFGVGSIFMNPDESFAHGLNERVPIKAFKDALDHWSIIIRDLASSIEP